MKRFAVANMKGGVGKTTSSIILADALSTYGGKRVLALDLDPQANLSWALLSPSGFHALGETSTLTRWTGKVADGEEPSIAPTLRPVGLHYGGFWAPDEKNAVLDLATADTKLRFAEMRFECGEAIATLERLVACLDKELTALSDSYDACVMDCSPALTALTRAGLECSDEVIVPTPLNALCLESLETFRAEGIQALLKNDPPLSIVKTRVGQAMGLAEQEGIRSRLREGQAKEKWRVLEPEFRESVKFMRALNPPETGPFRTRQSKYHDKEAELLRLYNDMKIKGFFDD